MFRFRSGCNAIRFIVSLTVASRIDVVYCYESYCSRLDSSKDEREKKLVKILYLVIVFTIAEVDWSLRGEEADKAVRMRATFARRCMEENAVKNSVISSQTNTICFHRRYVFVVTFRMSRRRREMYIGHACLCVCPRPHAHTTVRTDPDVTWGNGRVCP